MPLHHRAPLLDRLFAFALLACVLGPAMLALGSGAAITYAALAPAMALPAALGCFAASLAGPVRGVQLAVGGTALAANLLLSGMAATLVWLEVQTEAWEGFGLLYCGALAALALLVLASTLITSVLWKGGRRQQGVACADDRYRF